MAETVLDFCSGIQLCTIKQQFYRNAGMGLCLGSSMTSFGETGTMMKMVKPMLH